MNDKFLDFLVKREKSKQIYNSQQSNQSRVSSNAVRRDKRSDIRCIQTPNR